LSHRCLLSATENFGEQVIFFHHAQHCIRIAPDALFMSESYLHSSATIGVAAMLLLLYELGQLCSPIRLAYSPRIKPV
ncbi:MAG: hypothetical protein RSC36_09370, partial [Ruthenibacterium sp.]